MWDSIKRCLVSHPQKSGLVYRLAHSFWNHSSWLVFTIALYLGSRWVGKREPGIHCLRMYILAKLYYVFSSHYCLSTCSTGINYAYVWTVDTKVFSLHPQRAWVRTFDFIACSDTAHVSCSKKTTPLKTVCSCKVSLSTLYIHVS